MRILITGAGGFLGQGLVVPFEEAGGYALRLMDVRPFDSRHEVVVGDVADLAAVQAAVRGMEALIIAHMAPRTPNAYEAPPACFDINVKGTANLFHAAQAEGIKRVVLVSSQGAISGHAGLQTYPHDLPPRNKGGLYGLTKALQEVIAEQYAREHGMAVAALRVGYIVDGEKNVDKYGKTIAERAPPDADRRDIGEVARLCLECPDLTYETFTVMSTAESMDLWDVRYTCQRLAWKPKYDFSWLRPQSQ